MILVKSTLAFLWLWLQPEVPASWGCSLPPVPQEWHSAQALHTLGAQLSGTHEEMRGDRRGVRSSTQKFLRLGSTPIGTATDRGQIDSPNAERSGEATLQPLMLFPGAPWPGYELPWKAEPNSFLVTNLA